MYKVQIRAKRKDESLVNAIARTVPESMKVTFLKIVQHHFADVNVYMLQVESRHQGLYDCAL